LTSGATAPTVADQVIAADYPITDSNNTGGKAAQYRQQLTAPNFVTVNLVTGGTGDKSAAAPASVTATTPHYDANGQMDYIDVTITHGSQQRTVRFSRPQSLRVGPNGPPDMRTDSNLVVDGKGRAHIAWIEGNKVRYAMRDVNGVWSGIEDVATLPSQLTARDRLSIHAKSEVSSSFTNLDTIGIAYSSAYYSGTEQWANIELAEVRLDQGNTVAPVALSLVTRQGRAETQGSPVSFQYTLDGTSTRANVAYFLRDGTLKINSRGNIGNAFDPNGTTIASLGTTRHYEEIELARQPSNAVAPGKLAIVYKYQTRSVSTDPWKSTLVYRWQTPTDSSFAAARTIVSATTGATDNIDLAYHPGGKPAVAYHNVDNGQVYVYYAAGGVATDKAWHGAAIYGGVNYPNLYFDANSNAVLLVHRSSDNKIMSLTSTDLGIPTFAGAVTFDAVGGRFLKIYKQGNRVWYLAYGDSTALELVSKVV
jgi:hypothetical protein